MPKKSPTSSAKSDASETQPLKGDDSGISVETLIENAVRARLPRVGKDGSLANAMKPQKASVKKSQAMQAKASAQQAKARVGICDTCPRIPPTREDITGCIGKYCFDCILQVVYIVGAFLLLQYGLEVSSDLGLESLLPNATATLPPTTAPPFDASSAFNSPSALALSSARRLEDPSPRTSTTTTSSTVTTAENTTAENTTAENNTAENTTAENTTAENATADNATADNATAENATASNITSASLTSTAPGTCMFSLTLVNVDFQVLEATAPLLGNFTRAVQTAMARAAGGRIKPEDVNLSLSPGSVHIQASIVVPPDDFVNTKKTLNTSLTAGSMGAAVVAGVCVVPNIELVLGGPISVSNVSTLTAKGYPRDEGDPCDKGGAHGGGVAGWFSSLWDNLRSTWDRLLGRGSAASPQGSYMMRWWVLVVGLVFGLAIIAKSVRSVVRYAFSIVEKTQEYTNKAIASLLSELEGEIGEMIKEAADQNATSTMKSMVISGATKSIEQPIRSGVNEAQKKLNSEFQRVMPWLFAKPANLACTLAPVPVVIVVAKFIFDYLQDPPVMVAEERNNTALLEAQESHTKFLLVTNVLLNILWGLLCSWPVLLCVVNSGLSEIQNKVNDYLVAEVERSTPGGVQKLQSAVDAAAAGNTPDDLEEGYCNIL